MNEMDHPFSFEAGCYDTLLHGGIISLVMSYEY